MPDPHESTDLAERHLGDVPLREHTFSYDLEVSDRYQAYSAEILRLALLGIAGIGFLMAEILLKDTSKSTGLSNVATPTCKRFLCASLACLGLSAAGALLHRYWSTLNLANHLLALRADARSSKCDEKRAAEARKSRNKGFKVSNVTLAISAASLGFGALFLALSFIFGILFA